MGDIYEEIASELEPTNQFQLELGYKPYQLLENSMADLARMELTDDETVSVDETDWYDFVDPYYKLGNTDYTPSYYNPSAEFDAEEYNDLISNIVENEGIFYQSALEDQIEYDDYLDERGLFEA